MRLLSTAVTALFASLTGSASADTSKNETVGHFLVSLPARSLEPVIEYCTESVPEVKNELLEERAGFIDKLTEAGKPLLERLKDDPEFNAPVPKAMRQEMADVQSRGLTILKQQDPGVTCRTILANIQNATVDALRIVVEDTYEKFRVAGNGANSE